MSGLGLNGIGSTDTFGAYLEGGYRSQSLLPEGMTRTTVRGRGVIPLSPTQSVELKADYDFDPIEAQSASGTSTVEQYRRFVGRSFAAVQYQQRTPIGDRASNCLVLGGGIVSRNRFDQGLFQVSRKKAIDIGMLGLANDVSSLLFRNERISLTGNFGMSGMGQVANTDYLDYGMRSYNWDNYDISGGLSMAINHFDQLDIQQGLACNYERYNPGLYFFLDTTYRVELPTTVTFQITPASTLSISHSLEGYDDTRERRLASKVVTVLGVRNLEFMAGVGHNYLSDQVDLYGAGVRFNTGARIILNAGWESRAFGGKIINNEYFARIALAFGKYEKHPLQKREEPDGDFNFPVNSNFTIADAAKGLNSIQKAANFFYRSVYYPDSTAVTNEDGSIKWRYLSPADTIGRRTGVCADQSLAQAALLVENGYPLSYVLDSHSAFGPGGHSTAVVFDPYSNRYLNLEYGSYVRLTTNRKFTSPEENAEAILIGRGDPHDSFFLYNPPKGFLYDGVSNPNSQFYINDDRSSPYVNISDESGIKLVPEMGVKAYIGEMFWR